MTNAKSKSNNDNNHKTIGEELYLIYLKRRIAEDEDCDEVPVTKRKRTRSIGDELFSIHLKRSQGMNHESDLDTDVNHPDHQKDVKILQERKNVTAIPPSPVSP